MTAVSALLIIPGPAVFYVVARSVDQGRKAGLASSSASQPGIGGARPECGAWIIGPVALFGNGVLGCEICGAAYLIHLGIKKLLSRSTETTTSSLANIRT